MQEFVRGLLYFHAAAGMAAFFCAPVALLTVKGGKTHRRFGRYYFWLMAVVAATGAVVAWFRPLFFLVMIAIFSFYFSLHGYRVLKNKLRGPQPLDWVAAAIMMVTSGGLLYLGLAQPAGFPNPGRAISILFGFLGLYTGGVDVYHFLRPSTDKNVWWFEHMSGMLGSYIGAVSAFSAINLRFIPMPWRWLWPTIIGFPLVGIWIGYYQKKFRRRPEQAATA